MKNILLASLLAALSIAATSASAADAHNGYYAGAKIGNAHTGVNDNGVGGTGLDRNDLAVGAFGGYRYSDNLAVEGGWDYLGEFDYTSGAANGSFTADALHLEAVGIYPITKEFEVFGKLGGSYGYTKNELSGVGHVAERGFGVVVGAGASYWVDANVEVRGEWTRYNKVGVANAGAETGVDHIDFIGVSTAYHF